MSGGQTGWMVGCDKRAGHGQCGQMCFRILCLKQVRLWSLAGRPGGTCNGIYRPGRSRCITGLSRRLSAIAPTPRSATNEHAAIESIHQLPSRTSFLEWAVDNARASSQRPLSGVFRCCASPSARLFARVFGDRYQCPLRVSSVRRLVRGASARPHLCGIR